ncbi:hypothetical protein GGI20_005522 [Coemansia sp. BCRC 34301]|nr:hypothetical protein GGI20_005522 [Coemansia sp. BCRC 34301]
MRFLVPRLGFTTLHGLSHASPTPVAVAPRLDRIRRRLSTLQQEQQHQLVPAARAVATVSTANPWDYVLSLASHRGFATPGALSGEWLKRLLHRLQKIHRGQIPDAWSGIYSWLNQMTAAAAAAAAAAASTGEQCRRKAALPQNAPHYLDALPTAKRAIVELIHAHIYVLQVKREVARSLHTGARRKKSSGWNSRGDLRATQVALISKAFRHACPGLLLNFLLDWNTGAALVSPEFLDTICARYLAHPEQIRSALATGRQLYTMVNGQPGGPTTTGFIAALWAADNYEAAIAGLAQLVAPAPVPRNVVSALAIQLMQCASEASHLHIATQVFAKYRAWLWRSPSAYNIMLSPRALAYNSSGVVALLRLMRDSDVYPDPVIWTTIMNGMILNGRMEEAMKLFALHLDFLPRQHECKGDNMLCAPINEVQPVRPNLWQRWYAQTSTAYLIHPYYTNLLREMAARRQELQSTSGSRRPRIPEPGAAPVPWLPTLATHKMMLKHLNGCHRLREFAEHYELLKRYWPQYSQWTGHANLQGDGLRGIERLVRGCMAQNMPELRDIYGLVPTTSVGDSQRYYSYCERIQALASTTLPSAAKPCVNSDAQRPGRLVFNGALQAYSLNGDIRTVLGVMEKYPDLHDVATWTELVRCVLTQIVEGDQRMLEPSMGTDWIEFLLDLEQRLVSARGIRFTQVTFGQIIQVAVACREYGAVPRIVEYMSQKSDVRFNVDMLRMVLKLDYPFDIKCALVKSTLDGDGVRPDGKLLTLVVMMARNERDLKELPGIVSLFKTRFGILLSTRELNRLIDFSARIGLTEMAKYWTMLRYTTYM